MKQATRPPDVEVKYWDRYVDDVFGIVEGDEVEVESLVKYVNELNPDIQFTFKCLDEVSYLDFRDPTTNSPNFNIYYKPTNLGIFIN